MIPIPAGRHAHQSGAVLFVTMIFLLLMTIMALTTFTVSRGTQMVVGNLTTREQVWQTAQAESELALSSPSLYLNPNAILFDTTTGQFGDSITMSLDDAGTTSLKVNVTQKPVCYAAQQIVASTLDLSQLSNLECASLTRYTATGAVSPQLSCSNVMFRYTVQVNDPITNAVGSVTQGAAAQLQPDTAKSLCHSPTGALYF